jgi:mono/diheme cytochrome c family protein
LRIYFNGHNLWRHRSTDLILFGLIGLFGVLSCKEKESLSPLEEKGKTAYMATCIACHASDPSKDGSLGPSVAGSTKELLKLRVLQGKYPDGYKPKRNSKIMTPLPHLEKDIEALHAYLNRKK